MLKSTERQYIYPKWVQDRNTLSEKIPGINQSQSFSEFILAVIDHEIRTIKPIQSEHGTPGLVLKKNQVK